MTASAPDDVWTVGSAGADGPSLIEHWDGRRWRVMPSPPGSLLSITASSAGHVWATGVQAGDAGAPYVVHYTGMPCYAVVPIVRTISAGRYPFALADDQIARRLFVRDDDGTVDVIDTSSGSVVRKTPVGRYDYGDYLATSIAVDARAGRVFVANSGDIARDGNVSVLDASNGRVLRTVVTGAHPVVVATVDEPGGHVFVVSAGPLDTEQTGSVSMLDASTGRVLRTTAVGVYPDAAAVDTRTGRLFVVNKEDSTLSVLDTTRGTRVRTTRLGDVTSPPLLAVDERRGRVFVGRDGAVSILDATDGQIRRTVSLGAGSSVSVVTALAVDARAGHVFVCWFDDQGYHVSMLDAGTGVVLRTVDVAATPTALAVDTVRGRVFATGATDAQGNGAVQAFDARSGASLTTVTAGDSTVALAVDERAGLVFALNRGSARTLFTGSVTVIDANSGGTTTDRP